MYIKRHIEEVVERVSKRKSVVVITGPRQVGKSTMLKEIHSGIRYITMDSPLVREAASDNPSMFFSVNEPPLVIDEIQKSAELFEYIKIIADEDKKKGQFYLTGSQSLKLMKNVSDSLAGRAGVIKMLGLSSRELDGLSNKETFLPEHSRKAAAGATQKIDYMEIVRRVHTGGFPELYETEGDLKDWADYYDSYFQTYIEKDVRDIVNIQDESAFIKFVKAVASLTGQQLNSTTLAGICGKDVKTVQKWLSVLESSGLVYLLPPYYNNFSKRLVKMPKLYFLDTGLACWLLQWNTPEQLFNGAMWGNIFETYAFAEILKSFYNDGNTAPPLYYYRDKDAVEIDVVIEDGGILYPVEIKATSDPTKSMAANFKVLSKIPEKEVGEGAIICLCREILPISENIWMLPVNLI